MYQRRRARILLALLVLASLVLITIDFRSEDGPVDGLRGVATSVFGPVQRSVAGLLEPFGNALSSVGDVFSLREQNAALTERLDELESRRQSFADLERQNEELRDLLGMRDRSGIEDVLVARTVALAPSNYEWTITIDVGTADGVERNMPVINGDGLVGRVVQVTERASRVLLAIDPNFAASSRSAADGEVGSIRGRGSDLMLFRPLDPEVELAVDDEVVTNRYDYGLFPSGIPIGSVDSVGETTSSLDLEVLVRPYVDFTRLDVVMVILQLPIEEPPPVPDRPDDVPTIPSDLIPSPTPSPSPSDGEGG